MGTLKVVVLCVIAYVAAVAVSWLLSSVVLVLTKKWLESPRAVRWLVFAGAVFASGLIVGAWVARRALA